MVASREDGSLVVEGAHLLWEEPANSTEQQAADPEGVLPLTTLHHGSNLPRLIPLHKHSPKHCEATQLRVVRVGRHHRVKDGARSGGGGAAAGPVPAERNGPGFVQVAEHGLILEDRGGGE